MANILIVIAENGFRDEEFAEPYAIFTSAGHKVTVAGSSRGEAKGKLGMRVNVDASIDEITPVDYDAIVVAGGPGTPTYLWSNKALHKALQTVYSKGGVVAAICLAPVVLARAGLVKGKKSTVYPTPESLKEMEGASCRLQDEHVVIDGKIVTGDGPAAAKAFGEAILELL